MNRSRRRRSLAAALLVLAAAPLAAPLDAQTGKGRFFDLLDQAVREAQEAKQARDSGQGASAAPQRQLANIWNPQGCAFTDRSPLSLARATRLDRIELWYNWAAREATSAYEIVSASGQVAARGTLSRDSCDPYQASWCVAADAPGITLPAGDYTIRTPRARICQNGASGGQGFIRAWGGTVAAPTQTGARGSPRRPLLERGVDPAQGQQRVRRGVEGQPVRRQLHRHGRTARVQRRHGDAVARGDQGQLHRHALKRRQDDPRHRHLVSPRRLLDRADRAVND